MLDRERKGAAFRAQDRAIAEVTCDRSGVERRGHDDEAEIGTSLLQALEQREGEVALEVTLVELVEDDRVDAFEGWIAEQAARETPSVTKRRRVRGPIASSKRT